MIKVNFVSENEKFYLCDIEFESIKQIKEYVARWFPCEDMVICQVARKISSDERKE